MPAGPTILATTLDEKHSDEKGLDVKGSNEKRLEQKGPDVERRSR